MVSMIVTLFAVMFCLAILIGMSLAEQMMTARDRRQAEQQRLINSRWEALMAQEEELYQSRSWAHHQQDDDLTPEWQGRPAVNTDRW